MKKVLLAAAALVTMSLPVAAADMPLKAPVVARPFTWAGVYLGVNAGYAWVESDRFTALSPGFGGLSAAQIASIEAQSNGINLKDGDFTAGGQAGFNLQSGAWVYGAEIDLNYMGNRKVAGPL